MANSNSEPNRPDLSGKPDWAERAATLKEQLMKSRQVRAAEAQSNKPGPDKSTAQATDHAAQRSPDIMDRLMAELTATAEPQKEGTPQQSTAAAATATAVPQRPPTPAPQTSSNDVPTKPGSEGKPSKPASPILRHTTPREHASHYSSSRGTRDRVSGPDHPQRDRQPPRNAPPRGAREPRHQRRPHARPFRDHARPASTHRRQHQPATPSRARAADAGSSTSYSGPLHDRDLHDWLRFTGWNDAEYRRGELARQRQRRLGEIDRERAELEEAGRLSNRAGQQGRDTPVGRGGRPDGRRADNRHDSPDFGRLSRHRSSDLEAPECRMLGNYPVTSPAGTKRGRRDSEGDRDSPPKYCQTGSRGRQRDDSRQEPWWFGETRGKR